MSQQHLQQQPQSDEMLLLNQVQALVELERSLTDAMEQADPWLPGGTARPLPTCIDLNGLNHLNGLNGLNHQENDVSKVLAVARSLASRTSAPVGWNPQAPVIGFTTPSPMPHQLRGGSLGALQLEMAKQLQRQQQQQLVLLERKKREREEVDALKRKNEHQNATSTVLASTNVDGIGNAATAAKRLSVVQHQSRQGSATTAHQQQQQQRPRQPAIVADMNLSDDSSSSSDDDNE